MRSVLTAIAFFGFAVLMGCGGGGGGTNNVNNNANANDNSNLNNNNGNGNNNATVPTDFELVAPADNTQGSSVTPSLTWNDAGGETGYTVVIATNAALTTVVHTTDLAADQTAYNVPGGTLAPDTTYFWRVTATNATGETNATNSPFSFNTNVPGGFTLVAPEDGTKRSSLTPQLTWIDASGETGYTVEVATNADFSTVVHSAGLAADATGYAVPTSALAADTVYYWRIIATNDAGPSVASNAPFSFDTNLPGAFTLVSPENGTSGSVSTPSLSWTDATGETGYTVEIATDAAFTSIAHTSSLAADATGYTVPGGVLSTNTTYHWRVAAANDAGVTLASNAPFYLDTNLPGAFLLTAPADGTAGSVLAPQLTWTDAVGETGYAVEIASATDFATIVHAAALGADATSYAVPGGVLSTNTTYYWRVHALNTAGQITATNAPFSLDTNLPGAFLLTAPANGTQGSSTTPQLSWTNPTGEASLVVEIATDVGFSSVVHAASLGQDVTTYSVPAAVLSTDTTYYWRVTAHTGAGPTPAANAPYLFNTNLPGAFTLTAPTNGATGGTLTPQLTWTNPTGETGFTLEIATDSGFGTIVHSVALGAGVTSHTVPGGVLSTDTTYYWRVIASNDAGQTLASNAPFSFNTNLPTAFTLTAPADNTNSSTLTPQLTWTNPPGETGFGIEIATDSGFSTVVHSAGVGANVTTYTVPGGVLSTDTTYYWRVTAGNDAGQTLAWNAPYSFDTNLPGAFTLTAPANNTTNSTLTPQLTWTNPAGETAFTVEISTSSGFISVVHGAGVGANVTTYNVPGGVLDADKTYYWRVSATNAAGQTLASNAPYSFDTNRPGVFALTAPADGSQGSITTPVLAWTDPPGETGLTVEIATDAGFSSVARPLAPMPRAMRCLEELWPLTTPTGGASRRRTPRGRPWRRTRRTPWTPTVPAPLRS